MRRPPVPIKSLFLQPHLPTNKKKAHIHIGIPNDCIKREKKERENLKIEML